MLCIDELTQLLEQCTKEKWSDCSQKPALIHEERVTTYRWQHKGTGLGFLMVFREEPAPLAQEMLRAHINTFRQWGGKNLGLLYVLVGGVQKGATQALPYYGTLRTAILDFPNEKLHFGSDSPRFQTLIGSFAHVLGIPSGGKAREEIFARQCNTLGPRNWTREQLRKYGANSLLEWHPLYLSSIFPQLTLTLDGLLHHEDTVFILFPHAYPMCSYFIHELFSQYPDRRLVVLYAHSCTENAQSFAQGNGITLRYVRNSIVDVLASYGLKHEELGLNHLFWIPRIWFSYLRVIAPVQGYRMIGGAIVVDETYVFLSALSMAELMQIQSQIPHDCILVLHTQFVVDDAFLAIFSSYIWLYRDEVIRKGYIPIGIERAFTFFNSISSAEKKTFRWQDSYFQRGELFFDRHFGYPVHIFTDIAPDHPWLALGFLLSMHTHTIPFLLYDQEQCVLVVSNPEKKDPCTEDKGIHHLFSSLQKMGIDENDFGKTYEIHGLTVMSLVDES